MSDDDVAGLVESSRDARRRKKRIACCKDDSGVVERLDISVKSYRS